MSDFEVLRANMVEGQVRTSDVTDHRILRALMNVPREKFVPASMRELAYIDDDIPVGAGRTRRIMAPRVFAKLLQAADIKETDLVLDIGCATGYSSAVLAKIAESVVALEEQAELVEAATNILSDLGADNAVVVSGPLPDGYADEGPYDVIVVNGAIPDLPPALGRQLKNGGRLVTVIQAETAPMGAGCLYRRVRDGTSRRPLFEAAAPVLSAFAQKPEFSF